MKTAIVIGATGLVGSALVQLLLTNSKFDKVLTFGRRSADFNHPKLEEYVIDFDRPETWQHLVKGDVLFSALGTTLKQAGGQNAQYKIDFTYQYQFAEAAALNQVPVYVLVSSAGADPNSIVFYTRMKGELERQVKQLAFTSINIIQPGLLVGKRQEERTGEKVGYYVLKAVNRVGLFKSYQPIPAQTVAKAMLNAGNAAMPGTQMYALEKVFDLAE
ncbi:NAD(P)H-binding protein [Adhaeribacter aquaticus]|uniref:NAD(P)H-binding protein n=1 Tax=Adhaeribacter aquaticus TaxID=299567 RepID=UPI0003FC1CC6|nr:NAD(P)H-binding protein [Adhaeribacter aquaticus]